MALSNIDVRKHRNKRIVIEPFKEGNLTPAGYDLSLGYAILLSSSDGTLPEIDYRRYENEKKTGLNKTAPEIVVPGKSDVLVLTKERVHLSGKVLAQLHTRSGIAAKGFILNPLTVDPNFGAVHGRLTLRFFNFSDEPARLAINETIATLVFHSVESETPELPQAPAQEQSIRKYRHFPHVGPRVEEYLEFYDEKGDDDEGEKKFRAAVLELEGFRRKLWPIRKLIAWRETWSWRGLLPVIPLIIFDFGTVIVRSLPSLMSALGLPAETIHSLPFAVSVFALNLSYVAFLRSMAK
jgi:deoxycytidine triphosphate deaminase